MAPANWMWNTRSWTGVAALSVLWGFPLCRLVVEGVHWLAVESLGATVAQGYDGVAAAGQVWSGKLLLLLYMLVEMLLFLLLLLCALRVSDGFLGGDFGDLLEIAGGVFGVEVGWGDG